ncbi:hypothetical protein HOY80DRAFT_978746, partial [Tuber brumale]
MQRTCLTCSKHARHASTLIRSHIRFIRCFIRRSLLVIRSFVFAVRSPVYCSIVHLLPSAIDHSRARPLPFTFPVHWLVRYPPAPLPPLITVCFSPYTFRSSLCSFMVRSWFVRGRSQSFVLKRGTIAAVGVETGTGTVGNREGRKAAPQQESLWDLYCISFVSGH